MALPDLNAEVAAIASLPKRMELAHWLVAAQGFGSIDDYWSLPEQYLYAKIAVAYGGPRDESSYISLPKNYAWSDIYNSITGDTSNHYDWCERQALGWILAALNGETGDLNKVAYYIDLPIRITLALLAVEAVGTGYALFDDSVDTGFLLYDDGSVGILEFAE